MVDDESQITRVLRTSLSTHGYDIRVANDGETALEIMKDWTPDLVITDLAMPNVDGLELCRRLRTTTQVPIIVLSVRGEERTKVKALDAGADDYVTKPFHLRELVARLRSVLRRTGAEGSPPPPVIRAGELQLDLERRSLRKAGKIVHLSPKEFELLSFLMQHKAVPITHARVLRTIWGPEYGDEPDYLRSYVKTLRKKIEDDPAHPEYILTEPWVGYRFRDPSDPDAAPASDREEAESG